MRKIIFAIALAVPLFASAQVTAFQNGNFANYTPDALSSGPITGNYATLYTGSTALSGWTVGLSSVDVVSNGAYGAIGSGNSIDMLGSPNPLSGSSNQPGSISQTFATTVGQSYAVSFQLGQNPGYGSKSLYVQINGQEVGSATGYIGGNSANAPTITTNFTASSAATTLTFATSANATGLSGPVIANVSVSAVPEPETYAMLLGGIGLIGATLKRRRKSTPA